MNKLFLQDWNNAIIKKEVLTFEQQLIIDRIAEFIINMLKTNPLRKEIAQVVLQEIEKNAFSTSSIIN